MQNQLNGPSKPTNRKERSCWIGILLWLCWGYLIVIHSSSVVAETTTNSVTRNGNTTYLAVPSAEPFHRWLLEQPAAQDPQSPGFEILQSLSASLRLPQDGRSRFVLPRSSGLARRSSNAWDTAFATPEIRAEFQSRLKDLAQELDGIATDHERRGEGERAYRVRWLSAGFSAMRIPVSPLSWSPANSVVNPRRSGGGPKGSHPVTGWPASTYQLIQTPNFDIAFQGRSNQGVEIAEICEQSFAIWCQLFYSYWNQDPRQVIPKHSPFQVIIFRNKESYLRALERDVKNVAASTGYYNPEAKAAFLFWDPNRSQSTLVHELTHQYFMEAFPEDVHFNSDTTAGFWGVEGIALYIESMSSRDLGGARLIDVGGWDAPRLQSARFKILRDRVWFPWEEFGRVDGTRFRDPRDLSPRYSQASGLSHYWMEKGETERQAFLDHLNMLYASSSPLPLEREDEELLKDYVRFLGAAPSIDSEYVPFSNRNELMLSRTPIDPGRLQRILTSKARWESIDLSFTGFSDGDWPVDAPKFEVERLNVESTGVTDRFVPKVASMERLQELDLSNCRITSKGLEALRSHPSLKILWLVDTDIDDESLETVASLPRLETVYLTGTNVSRAAWEKLLMRNPRLSRGSTAP